MKVILGGDRVFISADEKTLPSQSDVIVPFFFFTSKNHIKIILKLFSLD